MNGEMMATKTRKETAWYAYGWAQQVIHVGMDEYRRHRYAFDEMNEVAELERMFSGDPKSEPEAEEPFATPHLCFFFTVGDDGRPAAIVAKAILVDVTYGDFMRAENIPANVEVTGAVLNEAPIFRRWANRLLNEKEVGELERELELELETLSHLSDNPIGLTE